MKRSSTTARIVQDSIVKVVGRFDSATYEDVKGYVRMKISGVTDRTILRHMSTLVSAGIVVREGANNHFTYRLPPQENRAVF